jgi:hypothetical protein
MMAGKKEGNPTLPSNTISIPSVMVSSNDGLSLSTAYYHLADKGVSTKLSIRVSSTPAVLDSPSMGHLKYPKVRVSENMIYVHSRGRWSVVLSSVTNSANNEWQLFIIPKKDNPNSNIWETELQKHGYWKRKISVGSAVVQNPVQVYSFALKRKCPDFIVYDDNNTKFVLNAHRLK